MKEFKACFIGIGSIARRHIKNLKSIFAEKDVILSIDAVRRNGCSIQEKKDIGINEIYASAVELKKHYDAIFITNPTEFHIDTLKQVHDLSENFFIEKPISSLSQLDNAKAFQTQNGKVYYVACPLRYHAVIQYIKNNVDISSIRAIRVISSSYLPDWRTGVDYRDTYSAHRNLGGGVSIDLIHEWDYITYLFGQPTAIKCFIGKKSKLEIDSDDYAIYIAEFPNMIAEIHLDYFGRKTMREIQMYTDEDTIIGDLINHRITYLKKEESIELNEDRDDFQKRELQKFLDFVQANKGHEEITNAIRVLDLSQGVIDQ